MKSKLIMKTQESTKIVESENARFICIYANNTREIYVLIEWLENCLLKRFRKGEDVLVETLAESSTLKKIVCSAAKFLLEYDGRKTNNFDKRSARVKIAAQIVENARSLYDMECSNGKKK